MQGLFKKVSQERVRQRKRTAMGNRVGHRVAVDRPTDGEHAKAHIRKRRFPRCGFPGVAPVVGFGSCGHREYGQV